MGEAGIEHGVFTETENGSSQVAWSPMLVSRFGAQGLCLDLPCAIPMLSFCSVLHVALLKVLS